MGSIKLIALRELIIIRIYSNIRDISSITGLMRLSFVTAQEECPRGSNLNRVRKWK